MVIETASLIGSDAPLFNSRRDSADCLQSELDDINKQFIKAGELPYYSSKKDFVLKLGRDVFEQSGVDFRIYDALWGRKYENGIVPEDDRVRDIKVSLARFGVLIGDARNNTAFLLDLNSQGNPFDLSVRKIDSKREYGAGWLVDDAKRYLGQSTGRFVSELPNLHYINVESFNKVYDIHNSDNIRKDFGDSASLLGVARYAVGNIAK